jgi:hypothetical protein
MTTRNATDVRIVLGEAPYDTVIEIDGHVERQIEAFTLYASARDSRPARLDLRRVLTPAQARSRGIDDVTLAALGDSAAENERVRFARMEIAGAVELIDDAMRAAMTAARNQARGDALAAFVIEDDGGVSYSLGDILENAARYAALRRYVDAVNGGTVILDGVVIPIAPASSPSTMESCQTSAELDRVADTLRAHVRGDDGCEPLQVVPPIPEITS